jgi:thymidylate synthase
MKQYLELIKAVIDNGVRKQTRTGVDTISYFGAFYKVNLNDGFPLIWDAWADENGNLETAYGYYWRHFPSAEKNKDGEWIVREVDQIKYVIEEIGRNPNSRRLVVNAWEPGNATRSKLPPCHYSFVFNVTDKKLNCHLTQRSGDIALGIPFNLAAYSLLTQVIAQQTGFGVGQFGHTIVDAHIYVGDKGTEMEKYDHLEGLKEQLKREPLSLPKLKIADKPIDELAFEDFELIDYQHHEKIKFEVAV